MTRIRVKRLLRIRARWHYVCWFELEKSNELALGAVRLYPASDNLAVAEGIETALAVYLATGLHAWATVSAVGMEALIVPDIVQTVIIFADNDKSETGHKSAKALARRMLTEGRTVKILIPDEIGKDWADVVAQEVLYV